MGSRSRVRKSKSRRSASKKKRPAAKKSAKRSSSKRKTSRSKPKKTYRMRAGLTESLVNSFNKDQLTYIIKNSCQDFGMVEENGKQVPADFPDIKGTGRYGDYLKSDLVKYIMKYPEDHVDLIRQLKIEMKLPDICTEGDNCRVAIRCKTGTDGKKMGYLDNEKSFDFSLPRLYKA